MKKFLVEVTKTAQSDIKSIISYISRELKNPLPAKRLAAKFRNNILNLEEMPKSHNLVNDEILAGTGIRKLLVDNYLVFYTVDDFKRKISIIRVLHSRRDWEKFI